MSSSAKYQIGMIGCGSRAGRYISELLKAHGEQVELAAVCDPVPEKAEDFIERYGTDKTRYFHHDQKMLSELTLDGVVVASPNKFHKEQALRLYERGIPFLLEKPVAITIDDSYELLQAAQRSKAKAVLGFVLRYTPIFTKIKEIVDSGELGDILVINAEEPVPPPLVIRNTRNWRIDTEVGGPFLLEKCTHDFDVFNWLIGAKAEKVSSFAERSYFTKKNQPAANCHVCPIAAECLYHSDYNPNGAIGDACVYDDFEQPDHQVVNVKYSNGAMVNFSYAWAQPRVGRSIHIMGTKGELRSNISTNQIEVIPVEGRRKDVRVHRVETDGSGHNGGDSIIAKALFQVISGEESAMKAGIAEGVEAAVVALAADESARTEKIIDLSQLTAKQTQGQGSA